MFKNCHNLSFKSVFRESDPDHNKKGTDPDPQYF